MYSGAVYTAILTNSSAPTGVPTDTNWEAVCASVTAWDSTTVFSTGYIYTTEVINSKTITSIFYVSGTSVIPVKPVAAAYSNGVWTTHLLFCEDYYTIRTHSASSIWSMIPTKAVRYKLSGRSAPGTTHLSEECLLSMRVTDPGAGSECSVTLFPAAADNVVASFDINRVVSNAAFGVLELFSLALGVRSDRYSELFGIGAFAAGVYSEALALGSTAIGVNTLARYPSSHAHGAFVATEWIGEDAHSSGRYYYSTFAPNAILPVTSKLTLATVASTIKSAVLGMADPTASFLANIIGGLETLEAPTMSTLTEPGEASVYLVKGNIIGRVVTSQELAIYECDFIIDMKKTGVARLLKGTVTAVHNDVLGAGAWVTPVLNLGGLYNRINISCQSTGSAAVYWSATLDISKQIITGI